MLRALGYPSLVSMESFRNPNFPLVADLLVWLTKRFDNDVDITSNVGTEEERVALIRTAAQFMVSKFIYLFSIYALEFIEKFVQFSFSFHLFGGTIIIFIVSF